MKDKYDVILKEKPIDEGLGKTEIIEMLSNLKDEEIIPLEIEATMSEVTGIIRLIKFRKMYITMPEHLYITKTNQQEILSKEI